MNGKNPPYNRASISGGHHFDGTPLSHIFLLSSLCRRISHFPSFRTVHLDMIAVLPWHKSNILSYQASPYIIDFINESLPDFHADTPTVHTAENSVAPLQRWKSLQTHPFPSSKPRWGTPRRLRLSTPTLRLNAILGKKAATPSLTLSQHKTLQKQQQPPRKMSGCVQHFVQTCAKRPSSGHKKGHRCRKTPVAQKIFRQATQRPIT